VGGGSARGGVGEVCGEVADWMHTKPYSSVLQDHNSAAAKLPKRKLHTFSSYLALCKQTA
jgi:hypothetical protein